MEHIRMNALTAASQFFRPSSGMELSRGSARRSQVELNGHLLLFGVATALALATASECRSVTHLPSLMYGAVLWIWWAVIASAMWKLSQLAPSVTSFSLKTMAAHLVAGSVLGYVHLLLLWSLGFTSTGWALSQTAQTVWRYLFNPNRFGIEILIYGLVFAIAGIIQYQYHAQREAIRALELERQLAAAHLQALQMQLEPHFLFNTLNAITTLVELGRQRQAAEMLSHLNAILKATLLRTAPEKVPVFQELEIVENYLAIEQVRFADRLHLELKVDPNALDGLLPCFLLQPIVENAIRHGIAHCENEGVIEASVRRDGSKLHLRVRDTGSARSDQARPGGHGIGLKNTRERLAHFYGGDHAMTAQPLATGGFEVAITIPYERCQQ
jgi:sensor histidine kinase YesM